jgi:hypothetical protein
MKKKTAKIIGTLFAVAFTFIALILLLVGYTVFGIIVLIFGFFISYGLIKNKNLEN